jgi:hypothetical protein
MDELIDQFAQLLWAVNNLALEIKHLLKNSGYIVDLVAHTPD